MFCHKCGAQIPDGAAFCHKCGTQVMKPGADEPKMEKKPECMPPRNFNNQRLLCPNCHSADLIPITETRTNVSGGGYGVGKGCCGWILLGPFGLLCGLCGTGVKSSSTTMTSWVCKDCGHKFRDPEDIKAEKNAEMMASLSGLLSGAAVLYIAGNLLADNGLELFGISNWIYIALGALGMILGTLGVLVCAVENLSSIDKADQKNISLAVCILSAAVFICGILFAIADIRFFWAPAWVYIVLGLLATIVSAIAAFVLWMLGLSEDDIEKLAAKYDPMLKKIAEKLSREK